MQKPGMTLLITAIVTVGACSPTVVEPATTPAVPLVTITTRGGDCPEGPCLLILVIERDGRVHQTAPTPQELGIVPARELAAIGEAIKTTDFGVMRLRPSTERCPLDVDGQEVIYDFGAPTGIQRISSCVTEIDPQHPAFASVRDGLKAGNAFPRNP